MTDRGRILVVDDHPTNRLKLQMSVKRLGYASATAGNGREALELLASEPHDLILLDIVMPEMDGYEVLAALKIDPELRDIPVLVISSLEDIDSVVKAIELGAEDHLPKSFGPVLLDARIGACLQKKRSRDQEREYLRQVERLTTAATLVEAEGFNPDALPLADVLARDDALGGLARTFSRMAREVYSRERNLRRQIDRMRIEVDQVRQKQQVRSITGTAYFKDLRNRADELRAGLNGDAVAGAQRTDRKDR